MQQFIEQIMDTTVLQRVLLALVAAVLAGAGIAFQYSTTTAATMTGAYLLAIFVFTLLYHMFFRFFSDIALDDTFLAVSSGAFMLGVGFLILGLASLYQPVLFLAGIVFLFTIVGSCGITARTVMNTSDLSMTESLLSVVLVKATFVTLYGAALFAALFTSTAPAAP